MAWQRFTMLQYLPDIPDLLKPADSWSVLTDANWRDGAAYRDLGEGTSYLASGATTRMEWVHPFKNNGVLYAGRDSGGSGPLLADYRSGIGNTLRTPASWTADYAAYSNTNIFTGGYLSGGVLVNCANLGGPAWFNQDTPATATDLDATLRFRALRPYKYQAIGIADRNTPAPFTVRWSDLATPGAAPTTWTPAATNSAGDVDISGAQGNTLVDGGQMGEDFAIYGQTSTHLMTYIGGSRVMTVRGLSGTSGIMARNCWADVGGGHVVLTRDDVVLVTPGGVQSLCDAKARKQIFSQIYAATYTDACQVWYERELHRAWIVYPISTDRTLSGAFILDLVTGQWGRKTLSRATQHAMQLESTAAGAAPVLALAHPNGTVASSNIYKADTDGGSGSGVLTKWYKHDLDLGDATRRKFLRGIRIIGDTGSGSTGVAGTVKVQVGVKNSVEESYTYNTQQSVALASAQQAPVMLDGRWFSVQIESGAATDKNYSVIGFELDWDWSAHW